MTLPDFCGSPAGTLAKAPPRGGTAASSRLSAELLLDDPKMFNG